MLPFLLDHFDHIPIFKRPATPLEGQALQPPYHCVQGFMVSSAAFAKKKVDAAVAALPYVHSRITSNCVLYFFLLCEMTLLTAQKLLNC